MDFRIVRCKGCGKRLAPWTAMCDNCRRLMPAVFAWGMAVVLVGAHVVLWLLEWAFGVPLGYWR